MRYQQYPDIKELYVLHKYNRGMAQGEESFIEEILSTGNDEKELERIGKTLYPAPLSTAGGWRSEYFVIIINTSTEKGSKLYEDQKAKWKKQWEQVDNNPEHYKEYTIVGNREDEDSGPIAIKLQHNPVLDNTPTTSGSLTTYQYIIWDIDEQTI